jgi:cytochrome bd-type quinol oxidase subunit 2
MKVNTIAKVVFLGKMAGFAPCTGVEVERRKNVSETISRMVGAVEALNANVGNLSGFKNLMIGVSFLGLLVLTGSYYFTADVKRDITLKQEATAVKLEVVTSQVANITTAVAVSEARHTAVLNQLEALNQYMKVIATREASRIPDPRGGTMYPKENGR